MTEQWQQETWGQGYPANPPPLPPDLTPVNVPRRLDLIYTPACAVIKAPSCSIHRASLRVSRVGPDLQTCRSGQTWYFYTDTWTARLPSRSARLSFTWRCRQAAQIQTLADRNLNTHRLEGTHASNVKAEAIGVEHIACLRTMMPPPKKRTWLKVFTLKWLDFVMLQRWWALQRTVGFHLYFYSSPTLQSSDRLQCLFPGLYLNSSWEKSVTSIVKVSRIIGETLYLKYGSTTKYYFLRNIKLCFWFLILQLISYNQFVPHYGKSCWISLEF